MRRLAALAVVAWSVVAPSRSLAWSHGWHRGPRVFVGVWGPSPPVWPPYYAPYPVHSYPPPPPPDDPGQSTPPSGSRSPDDADDAPTTYGLVQLRGVLDGADVDLDGRFWLRARDLDDGWLALPKGPHRLRIRVDDAEPVERRVQVAAGRTQVVRIGPSPRPPA